MATKREIKIASDFYSEGLWHGYVNNQGNNIFHFPTYGEISVALDNMYPHDLESERREFEEWLATDLTLGTATKATAVWIAWKAARGIE